MGRVESCFICRDKGDIFECIKRQKESLTDSIVGEIDSGTHVRIDGGYLKELLDFAIRQKEEVERLSNEVLLQKKINDDKAAVILRYNQDIEELHKRIKEEADRAERYQGVIKILEKDIAERKQLLVIRKCERPCGKIQELIDEARSDARDELVDRLKRRLRRDERDYLIQGDFKSRAVVRKVEGYLSLEVGREYGIEI